ncbi:MAG TPA: EamA family transporter, partial [Terriglobales bacterium]
MAVKSNSAPVSNRKDPDASRFLLLLAFAIIYIVWGSTYLAIRYAVETIPPLVTAGVRHLSAGSVLFLWAWMRGYRPTRREWYGSAVLGFLFFFISHGSLHWAEQVVPSGLAALLVATEPLWITVLGLLLSHKQNLNFSSVTGLIIGFIGVLLLTTDHQLSGTSASLLGSIAIVVGTVTWAIGMIYSQRSTSLPQNSVARAGMSLLIGSWMLLITAGITGEFRGFHWSAVSNKSLFGLLYLIVFGSIVAYTAYMWLLERCSPTLIATHTYVNPIVAVLLGWGLAGEAVGGRVVVAAVLVIASVIFVSVGH